MVNYNTILKIIIIFLLVYLFTFIWFLIMNTLDINYSFIANIPIILLILGITYYFMNKKILYGLIILILILPLQPFLTSLLSSIIDPIGVKVFVALKEILTVIILIFLIFKRIKKIKLFYIDFILLVFINIHIAYLILGNEALFLKVISFREAFMIFAFYTIGRLSYTNFKELKKFSEIIIYIGLTIALFGLIERFLFTMDTWNFLGAFDYVNLKYEVRINEYGFPVNWFTYINDELKIRRIVGTVLEPTSFSRFLSFIALLSLYYFSIFKEKKLRNRKIFLILLLIITIGMSRGGLLIVFIGILIYFYNKQHLISLVIAPIFIIGLLGTDLFSLSSGNSQRHIHGLTEGIIAAYTTPAGHGLGASGQLAVLYGNISGDEKVSESYIGGLGYQLGMYGIVPYILFNIVVLFYLIKYKAINHYLALLIISGLLGVFITSFLSNSAVSPISSALIFIYTGISISYIRKEKKYE